MPRDISAPRRIVPSPPSTQTSSQSRAGSSWSASMTLLSVARPTASASSGRSADLDALGDQPGHDVARDVLGLGAPRVRDEQDPAGHAVPSAVSSAARAAIRSGASPSPARGVNQSRYSTLPVVPRMGLARRPRRVQA